MSLSDILVIFAELIGLSIGLFIYCVPIIIARRKKHHLTIHIAMITIIFGWTFVGWLIALRMAFAPVNKDKQLI